MDSKQDLPVVSFASQQDWERWLQAEHGTARGLWLKLAKKGSSIDSVTYEEAIQSALCYAPRSTEQMVEDQPREGLPTAC